jgi:hypothetical protein
MAADSERRNWSRYEVEATVAAYLDMLVLEREGLPFKKAERRRALQALLEGRSEPAIERKHQNISAILIELGLPYINGYKPLFNYQGLLREIVESQIGAKPELPAAIEAELARPIAVASVDDILARLVDPPDPRPRRRHVREKHPPRYGGAPKDYVALEARNSALGRAGELFAVNFEKARLVRAGQERLADDVEHVSVTRGDGDGYDIRSFDPDGRKRLIEVKTTGYGAYTPFFVSPNELEVSRHSGDLYHVYRLYDFRQDARLFVLRGPMDRALNLEPSQFRAFVG